MVQSRAPTGGNCKTPSDQQDRWTPQVTSLLRSVGFVLAQTCDNPGKRALVVGITWLIATAIERVDRLNRRS